MKKILKWILLVFVAVIIGGYLILRFVPFDGPPGF